MNSKQENGYMKGIIFEVIWENTISSCPNTYNYFDISKYQIPNINIIKNTSLKAFKKYLSLKKK